MAERSDRQQAALDYIDQDETPESRQAISLMKDDTDSETFRSVFDEEEPQDDSDHSLEQHDETDNVLGQPIVDEGEEDEEQEASEQQDEDGEPDEQEPDEGETDEPQRNERDVRTVPSYRLREQSERAEQAERRLAEMQMRLDMLERGQRQPPPQPQPPQQPPDMFADPDNWQQNFRQQIVQDMHNQHVNRSLAAAEAEFGAEFQYAKAELLKRQYDPAMQAVANQMYNAPDPGRALMRWAEPLLQDFREQQARERLERDAEYYGMDPQTFERAISRRPSGQQVARTASRGVPSLNSAGGSGAPRQRINGRTGGDISDEELFNDMFTPLNR